MERGPGGCEAGPGPGAGFPGTTECGTEGRRRDGNDRGCGQSLVGNRSTVCWYTEAPGCTEQVALRSSARPRFLETTTGGWGLSAHRPQDVRPQDPVRGLLPQDLHQAVRVRDGLGPAVGSKGELPDFVLDALGETEESA